MLHVRSIAVSSAVVGMFAVAIVGSIGGLSPWACCERALLAAAMLGSWLAGCGDATQQHAAPTPIATDEVKLEVVDEAALAWALKNRIISGAALDVYEREPVVHPRLLALENVVLAPHMGSGTIETRTAMADLAVRNVLAVLNGELAITPVGQE